MHVRQSLGHRIHRHDHDDADDADDNETVCFDCSRDNAKAHGLFHSFDVNSRSCIDGSRYNAKAHGLFHSFDVNSRRFIDWSRYNAKAHGLFHSFDVNSTFDLNSHSDRYIITITHDDHTTFTQPHNRYTPGDSFERCWRRNFVDNHRARTDRFGGVRGLPQTS